MDEYILINIILTTLIIFLVLKFTLVVTWSWLWILSPLWGFLCLFIIGTFIQYLLKEFFGL